MAQIPTGSFGQSVAGAGPNINVPRGDPIGQAVERTGRIAQDTLTDAAQQQTRLDAERQRAQAALSLAATTNDMHDAHDVVSRGVLEGTIPADQARQELQSRIGKIRTANLQGYSDTQRMVMDAHVDQQANTLERSLNGVVVKRQQQETAGVIDNLGEQFQRMAMRQGPQWAADSYRNVLMNTGPAAGLNEAQIQKMGQAFSERVHYSFYENAGTAALTKDDDKALGGLVAKLQGPDGEPLDPTKKAQLVHQLFGWQQHILAKKARQQAQDDDAERRRYNEAVDVFNQGSTVAMGGGYFSPEFITELTTKGAGTKMEPAINSLIASQKVVAGFASYPADQRAAALEKIRAERANPAVGTDPLNEKLLAAMTTMDDKMRREFKENPWAAAQQAGVIKDAPQFNVADPSSSVAVMQQRMALISRVESWGGAKVSPLQPQEVEQVAKMVRTLPLDQAATMLGQMGQTVGDSERVAALAKQMHDKDGALGLAMLYANSQTTQGRVTAELILRGDQAIRDKAVMIDRAAETGWQGAISKAIRGAYSNKEVEDAAVEASFKIAAAKYAQNGSADIPEAIALATGGIVDRNGQKFPLPYGMKEAEFDKRVGAIKPEDIAQQAPGGQVFAGRTPMPLADFVATLPKATLVHAGQGMYNVRAGSYLVTNNQGQRITLRVNP